MPLVKAPQRWLVRPGFTLVELLVVIGIIALLIPILLPALNRARESANMIRCMTTLRNMGQARHLHAAEHGGYMPIAAAQNTEPLPAGNHDTIKKQYNYLLRYMNIAAQ